MNRSAELHSIEKIRTELVSRLGLNLDHAGMAELSDILNARFRETHSDGPAAYLQRLTARSTSHEELRALASRLTVQETYFYRNPDHFRALSELVLPDRLRAGGGGKVRLLSAGTATGEEAYTMAILARDILGDAAPERLSILGVDIDPDAVRRARLARYGPWSLRATPQEILRRCFRQAGEQHELVADVRSLVTFEERNLVEADPGFWQPGLFDVIFCRNVIIYFTGDAIRDLIARLTRSLAPGGYLFLGHSENLRGLSSDYSLMHTHETFYYKRRGQPSLRPEPEPAPQTLEPGWFEAIGRAAEKIATLAARPPPAAPQPAAPSARVQPGDLARASELFRQERFDDVILLLRDMTIDSRADPDALLLSAAVLTNRGQHQEAERLCRRILASDEMHAGAHYLISLGRDQEGDARAALHHARTAVYLDPTFAMPHLHLGRLARRGGDMESARREFEQTLHLLAREDTSRILLFGGGFQRAALLQIGESELRTCGGHE